MPQVVRSRIGAPHGPPSVAPSPRRFRSLADREAVEVLHRAARVLVAALPELTERLVDALYEQEPGYRPAIEADRSEVWQEVHRSLRHNVGSLIQPREFREAAHRTSRRIGEIRAGQGVPLDAVLHAFRMGGAMVWQDLVAETARRNPDDVRLLVHVAADVWNFVDEHCGVVADAYRQAERRLTWRRENRQRLMTAALLDGTARIADLPDAAAMLGIPEHGRYAVLAVQAVPAVPVAHRAPHVAALPPLTLPAGTPVLWHSAPEAELAILPLDGAASARTAVERGSVEDGTGPDGGSDADTDAAAAALGELALIAAELSAPDGTRTGISSVVEGLAGLGDARRLARTALRACPAAGGVVLLDDHLPTALVVSSPDLGTALAARVLGPLGRLDPADRDVLIATLTAWLDSDGSAQRAGARLYCHRNTVLNRLRRFEQLTGRCLTRPSDAVEVSLALAARRLLGG
ncbi:helix-turn-helix domain-containing protein [Streptomyces sp. NBC_01433]|uniref:helix-turn-helix domain-containing protein n=1 Tax=Streptomyces sp. NBC_01433 TaxID=2903864 RepID=UPI00224D25AF|nr:helix-turn-helix domain-containing protein [Streptomyces sp. NBC_01433]MCX4677958.1 helix-turn-helix domain-containing protein [Streptomyces sp. NBC_01433]